MRINYFCIRHGYYGCDVGPSLFAIVKGFWALCDNIML
jgi:hypothetical protein